MTGNKTRTIVFITGAFVSNTCWDEWILFFESKGYKTYAPAWPYKNTSPELLRNTQPNEAMTSVRLASLTQYFENIVKKLPEKPILVGHSIGGLIAQILVNRNLASAGVFIHSLAPLGVFTFKFSFYKAGWGPLGFFTPVNKAFLMSFKQWQYAFTNGMTAEEQAEGYYSFLTPESKRLVRDGISQAAKVNFKKPHVPVLFLSGDEDNFIPASLNFSNYKKYSDTDSEKAYKEFKGRNHFVLGQKTWKEEAQYISSWLDGLFGSSLL